MVIQIITTTIFPGRYMQGFDALMKLGEESKRFGTKGLILADQFVLSNIFPDYKDKIMSDISAVIEEFGGECCDPEIDRLKAVVEKEGLELVIGIGGGKTLDTAKAVAFYKKIPVIIVPTIASTDAPCSALSVIYTEEGEFDRYLVLPKNPDMVVVDSKIIAQAPERFLVSGMGDALATWFEAESCRKKYASNMTGYLGSMTAYALARLCYETLLQYGVAARVSASTDTVTPALEHVIEANTLLSGLGFESGGLAAAHAIHNGLTALEPTHKFFHGEKVAIGTLTSLFLTDKPIELIDEVYEFCEAVGLPTTLAEIGLDGVNKTDLYKVAEKTLDPTETIHNEAIPISTDSIVAAMLAADAYGKRRK